jgi:hypothetical protein
MARTAFFLLLVYILLAFGQIVAAQVKAIDRDMFSDVYRRSDPMVGHVSWRSTSEEIRIVQGKKILATIVTENVSNDTWREKATAVSDGKEKVSESINLKGTFFCRTDAEQWKKASFNCSSGPGRFVPPDYEGTGNASVEVLMVDGMPVQLFNFHVRYKDADGAEKSYQRKFWVSAQGRRLKEQASIALTGTNEIVDSFTETFEYDLRDLKIARPIK